MSDLELFFSNYVKVMWDKGHDGKDIAIAMIKVAGDLVRKERPGDLAEMRELLK